ncbi:hypothetical protein ACLK2E_13820 [Escherichia coli]
MRSRMLTVGDSVVKDSLASLVGLLTLAVHPVLVPRMVFFLLKDKEQMLNAVRRCCRATAAWPGRYGKRRTSKLPTIFAVRCWK